AKFAESGWRIFGRAIDESSRREQNYISLGHILIALAADDAIPFKNHIHELRALCKLSTEPTPVEVAIEKIMDPSPKFKGKGIRIAPEARQFLQRAMEIAHSNERGKIEA